MHLLRRSALLAVVGAGLVASAPASAATPFSPGTGGDPDVAVGPTGVGHVVWTPDEAGDRVGYCRVPRGAGACDRSVLLSFPGGAAANERAALVYAPTAAKVVIIGGCWQCNGGGTKDRVIRWTSVDGGDSFDTGTEITGPSGFDLSDGNGAWLDAEGLFVGAGGRKVRAMAPAMDLTPEVSSFGTNYGPEVVRVPGQNLLVQAVDDLNAVSYSVFGGALTANAINTQGNWSSPQALSGPEGDDDASGLNAGPSGVFLHYKWFVANDSRIGLRRFDPATKTFGAPTYIEGDDAIDNSSLDYPDTFQDESGRIHAVWRTLYDGGRLRYRVSDTTGATFGPAMTLAKGESVIDPRVAAAPDGTGFASWRGVGASPIRVVALDPQPESASSTTTPGGGTATPTSPATPITPATPAGPASPGSAAGAAQATKTTTVPGASITFGVPRDCVAPGQTFRVTLKWKRKKRKGSKFVKVTRADFYVGSKRVKVDRKAPFVQTLTVLASSRPGSEVTVRARAFIKVRRGKAPKKSIRAKVKVCA
ncbi:MAG: hypothetical protein HZB46_13950 [Solirubrobacterales bacterium]|nr:hypothetical protein [Solirubrobacterales bacterium]